MTKKRNKDLPYNIKYIQVPGNKLKTAFYEIKPGVWVKRSQVPEVKQIRKELYRANREQDLAYSREYHQKNKTKIHARQKKYRAKNREVLREKNNQWDNTEYGYIMNLYSSAKKDAQKGRRKGQPFPFEFNKKTWWQHWLMQKNVYGMQCPATKVQMTHIRGTKNNKKTPTNISRDQIWPGRGYTKTNLIFTSVDFNDRKRSITPAECEFVYKLYNQRAYEALAGLKKLDTNFYSNELMNNLVRSFEGKTKKQIIKLEQLMHHRDKAKEEGNMGQYNYFVNQIKNFYKENDVN